MPDATILIVEDEAIVAADLAGKLNRLGYTISGSTARGEDALSLVQEHHPDLGVDGYSSGRENGWRSSG